MKNSEIPFIEKGEWIIAYIIMANIALQQNANGMARNHLEDALEIAEQIQIQAQYDSPKLSKFAKIAYGVEGTEETLLLPIINGLLISPIIDLKELVPDSRGDAMKEISLKEVSVSYFKLHFKIERLVAALKEAKNATSSKQFIAVIGDVLDKSFDREVKMGDLLDTVMDNFMLARNMVSMGNGAIALLALRNAEQSLESYSKSDIAKNHLERIVKMKEEIKAISKTINKTSN